MRVPLCKNGHGGAQYARTSTALDICSDAPDLFQKKSILKWQYSKGLGSDTGESVRDDLFKQKEVQRQNRLRNTFDDCAVENHLIAHN